MDKILVNCDEARQLLGGISRSFFYAQISKGGIFPKPLKIGKRSMWLYSQLKSAVEELAEGQK